MSEPMKEQFVQMMQRIAEDVLPDPVRYADLTPEMVRDGFIKAWVERGRDIERLRKLNDEQRISDAKTYTEMIRAKEAEVERLRAEIAERDEMTKGHPAMCCGQCHEAIKQAEARLAQRDEEWCLAIDPLNVTTTLGVEMRRGGPSWVASYLREREQLQRDEDRANAQPSICPICHHPDCEGTHVADYGLYGPDGRPLAAAQPEEEGYESGGPQGWVPAAQPEKKSR